jgi:hypothetical protein
MQLEEEILREAEENMIKILMEKLIFGGKEF